MNKKKISLLEVGPRDGFQNLKQFLPTEKKLEIIDGLISTGVTKMEITSFVSPKAIPQMADAAEISRICTEKYPQLELYALTPNRRGVENAYAAGVRHMSYVISVSEKHNMRNINRSHDQSFADLEQIIRDFPNVDITVGMATALGCPFEGEQSVAKVVAFAERLWDAGVRKMYPADTIGVADPGLVRRIVTARREALPEAELQIHIHDTRGMGLVNTLAAIECGISTVQSTLGGLGGCPFAPGASGNTATEDLVYMLEKMGYDTGIDFDKLLALSKYQKSFVDGIYSGHQICINESKQPCC